ncbi:30S ribosomal protein S6 [Patescibacteria group bacterium]|nr:30S ribosomal protein S6 [Patescibacteria group bacterium]
MRDYELTVLVKPNLTDKELDKEVKNLTELLTKAGAKVSSKNDFKKQKTAYPVADFGEAYYGFLELDLDPAKVSEVDRLLKLQENFIRYLLVKAE